VAERGKRRKGSKMAGRQDGGIGGDRAMEAAQQQRGNGGRAAAVMAMVVASQQQQAAGRQGSRRVAVMAGQC
jgi:hypothetical protein